MSPESNSNMPAAIQLVDNLDFSKPNSQQSENQLLKFIHSIVKEASLEHQRVKNTVASTVEKVSNTLDDFYTDDKTATTIPNFNSFSQDEVSQVTYFPIHQESDYTTSPTSTMAPKVIEETTPTKNEAEFVTFSIVGPTSAEDISTKFASSVQVTELPISSMTPTALSSIAQILATVSTSSSSNQESSKFVTESPTKDSKLPTTVTETYNSVTKPSNSVTKSSNSVTKSSNSVTKSSNSVTLPSTTTTTNAQPSTTTTTTSLASIEPKTTSRTFQRVTGKDGLTVLPFPTTVRTTTNQPKQDTTTSQPLDNSPGALIRRLFVESAAPLAGLSAATIAYGAAAMMPLWLPAALGRKKRRRRDVKLPYLNFIMQSLNK